MKIGTKVNLILIIVLIIGISISGLALANTLKNKVEREISSKALVLMEMNNSIRNYTNDRVQPWLLPKLETEENFIPESIPTFSVREVFEYFRSNSKYADFFYKDAALNPTNLRDKADDFEIEIVKQLRQKPDTELLSGYRDNSGIALYYTAKPFKIKKESCLRCHSTIERAPKSQINTYGANGLGWKLNEIVAAQIVYVPAQNIIESANRSFMMITGIMAIVFVVVIVIINLMLKTTVLERIQQIASVAKQVSVGDMNANFGKQNKDEIGDLAEAFNRMKYSLEIAMNMLENKNG